MYRGVKVREIKRDSLLNKLDKRLDTQKVKLQENLAENESETENVCPNERIATQEKYQIKKGTFLASLSLSNEKRKAIFEQNKFFYLKMPDLSNINSVYELKLCRYDEVNQSDFYTLSKNGVCRFAGKFSEFTALSLWEKDYKLFYKVQQIAFFHNFRLLKNFFRWRKSIRIKKTYLAKKALKNQAIILNEALSKSIFYILHEFQIVESTELFAYDFPHSQRLEKFISAQLETANQFKNVIKAFKQKVKTIAKSSCKMEFNKFKAENNIAEKNDLTYMEKLFLQGQKAKLSHFLTFLDYILRQEFLSRCLGSLLRLRSFLVVDAVKEVIEPNDLVNDNARRKSFGQSLNCAIFIIELDFHDEKIRYSLNPTIEEIVDSIEASVNDALKSFSTFTSMTSEIELSEFVLEDKKLLDPVSMTDFLIVDEGIVEVKEEIIQIVLENYEHVETFCKKLVPMRETFLQNKNFHFLSVEDYRNVEISQLEQLIEQFQLQQKQFSEITACVTINIFHLDCVRFKEELLPSPLKCLQAFEELIPLMFWKDADPLGVTLKQSLMKVKTFQRADKDLKEKILLIQQTYQELTEKIERLTQLKELMEKYGWEVSSSVIQKHEAILNSFNRLQDDANKFAPRK